jgi:hypothetical protein
MLRSSRRPWFRALALWLLLLAASPATAPFSTMDLGPVSTAPSVDAAKTKSGSDPLVWATAPGTGASAVHVRSIALPRSTCARHALDTCHVVLRL